MRPTHRLLNVALIASLALASAASGDGDSDARIDALLAKIAAAAEKEKGVIDAADDADREEAAAEAREQATIDRLRRAWPVRIRRLTYAHFKDDFRTLEELRREQQNVKAAELGLKLEQFEDVAERSARVIRGLHERERAEKASLYRYAATAFAMLGNQAAATDYVQIYSRYQQREGRDAEYVVRRIKSIPEGLKKYKAALERFGEDPREAEPLWDLCQLAGHAVELPLSERIYLLCMREDHPDHEVVISGEVDVRLTRNYYRHGHYDRVLEACRTVAAKYPTHEFITGGDVLYLKGMAYLNTKDFVNARATFFELKREHPDHPVCQQDWRFRKLLDRCNK